MKAFESFRRRRDHGETVDFDGLCAEHPELEDNLRFLNSVYLHGKTSAPTVSFRDLLADRFGEDGVARFSLDAGEDLEPGGPGGERYVCQAEIGRGGMSRVLRVWDRETKRPLAMKVSLIEDCGQAPTWLQPSRREAVERVLEEALVTAQLDHPGVVPVFDLGVDREGRGFFTMRLVKGYDLRQVIALARRGAEGWSIPRCVRALARVSETVAYAHAKGVVHRDLKPLNIMVGFLGETYVIDWGLAKLLAVKDRHAMRLRFALPATLVTVETRRTGKPSDDPEDALATPAGTVVGTPVYMPPEQAEGKVEQVNQTSDVYSLGAVLYTLLAGRPPYVPAGGKASPLSILGSVIEGPPPPVRDIDPTAPRSLVAICEKAMARSQADRYPDAVGLARDLEAYATRGEARSPRVRVGAFLRASRESRWAWIAAIVLSGVAAYAIAFRPQGAGRLDELEVRAVLQELEALESALDAITPAMSHQADAVNRWLDRARALSARAADYADALERIDSDPDGSPNPLRDPLRRVVERLEALEGGATSEGTIAAVERRLAFSCLLRKRTIEDLWPQWQETVAAIADRARSPGYGGFLLDPQEGLVPIGGDPVSSLWEFGHLETGSIPRRGPAGALEISVENGLVFVLVPAVASRGPVLVSKRLMTRAQWQRVTGPGSPEPQDDRPLSPVTDVRWADVERVLDRIGLALPKIEEWPLAAGGGETTAEGGSGARRRGRRTRRGGRPTIASATWRDCFSATGTPETRR